MLPLATIVTYPQNTQQGPSSIDGASLSEQHQMHGEYSQQYPGQVLGDYSGDGQHAVFFVPGFVCGNGTSMCSSDGQPTYMCWGMPQNTSTPGMADSDAIMMNSSAGDYYNGSSNEFQSDWNALYSAGCMGNDGGCSGYGASWAAPDTTQAPGAWVSPIAGDANASVAQDKSKPNKKTKIVKEVKELNSAKIDDSSVAEEEDKEEDDPQLQFRARNNIGQPVRPPPAEEETQLLGDLLFLRIWPLVSCATDINDAPGLCGRVVGKILAQPRDEIINLVVPPESSSDGRLRAKTREVCKALGTPLAEAGGKSSGSKSLTPAAVSAIPGGGPPADRHGDLLFVLVAALVDVAGENGTRLVARICGLLMAASADIVRQLLEDNKRLRTAVKGALKKLEAEQTEEREARQTLSGFCAATADCRCTILMPAARSEGADGQGDGSAGTRGADSNSKAQTQAVRLLRLALSHTVDPAAVARKVCRALRAMKVPFTPRLAELLEQCGIPLCNLPRSNGAAWFTSSRSCLDASASRGGGEASHEGGAAARSKASTRNRSARRQGAGGGGAPAALPADGGASNAGEAQGVRSGSRSRQGGRSARRRSSSRDRGCSAATTSRESQLSASADIEYKPEHVPREKLKPSAAAVIAPISAKQDRMASSASAESQSKLTGNARAESQATSDQKQIAPGLLRVPPELVQHLGCDFSNTVSSSERGPAVVAAISNSERRAADLCDVDDKEEQRHQRILERDVARDMAAAAAGAQAARDLAVSGSRMMVRSSSRPRDKAVDKTTSVNRPEMSEPAPSTPSSPWPAVKDSVESKSAVASPAVTVVGASPASAIGASTKSSSSHWEPSVEAIPEAGKKKKSAETAVPSSARRAVSAHGLQPPSASGKKKRHVWMSLEDAFNRQKDEAQSRSDLREASSRTGVARSIGERIRGATSESADDASKVAELRQRQRELAEEKMLAVGKEDFQLAASLKQEEQQVRKALADLEGKVSSNARQAGMSWADRVGRSEVASGGSVRWRRSASVEPMTSTAAGATAAVGSTASGASGDSFAKDDYAKDTKRHGLVYVLTAPGQLDAETFKPLTSHVARRDALARIASAALWRSRGQAFDDVIEVIFIFEDCSMLRMKPKFVVGCPVPSEYHIIQAISKAFERRSSTLGIQLVPATSWSTIAGDVEQIMAEYSRGPRPAVVLLHESNPYMLDFTTNAADQASESCEDDSKKGPLIFFLGAVRDMSADELKYVQRACSVRHIRCLEASLGQQAEFTSKVIDVLQGHHLFGRLYPAVKQSIRQAFGASDTPPMLRRDPQPKGTFWVLVPIGGGPRDLAADDHKRDGVYEVPRCLISQLWCSKNEHSRQIISFVFATGEVLTVFASLVTCLKMQHRAAPTEKNLVSALHVGIGDKSADPTLKVDKGCVTLRKDAADLAEDQSIIEAIEGCPTVFADISLESGQEMSGAPPLNPYDRDILSSVSRGSRNVVVLLRHTGGRDFPRGFRDKFMQAMHRDGPDGRKISPPRLLPLSVPKLSVNATISLLGHYWQVGALAPALKATVASERRGAAADRELRESPPPRRGRRTAS
eukprot:TRINITY_DN17328_c0_g5_i1.p1 TRINITY_DN17328_c0_g5~~TRINITY_DN17328_c0_g5_i1.p1  ORF type:complete len:1576 (-),score=243.18 TRINITY_DN17328_c0_g5_i1:61-4788(-)